MSEAKQQTAAKVAALKGSSIRKGNPSSETKKHSDTPLRFSELKKMSSVKAVKPYPLYNVELDRLWLPDKVRTIPSIFQQKNGKSQCFITQISVNSKHDISPPHIAEEMADLKQMKNKRIAEKLSGNYADFHALSYLPKLVKKIAWKKKKGDDIPNSVFGTDTRYIFNDTDYPWCISGRVENENGVGTGCMIGKRLLLTASHMINWTSDGAGWIKFSPAYYNGVRSYFGSAWGTRVIYWNKASGSLSNFETAFDYVIVVLDRDMGDITGYAGYRTYKESWNGGSYWQHIGYPSDLSSAERPAFYGNGAFSSVSDESTSGQTGYVMGHFMDVVGGHSGGPFWGWWEDEDFPRVVGVHSASSGSPAYSTAGDNEGGGGPGLSTLISYARENY